MTAERERIMVFYSVTDVQSQFPALLSQAGQEPITIREGLKDIAVMMSPEEFRRLKAAQSEKVLSICNRAGEYAKTHGLTDEILADLLSDIS